MPGESEHHTGILRVQLTQVEGQRSEEVEGAILEERACRFQEDRILVGAWRAQVVILLQLIEVR